jgi:hypothetical protein
VLITTIQNISSRVNFIPRGFGLWRVARTASLHEIVCLRRLWNFSSLVGLVTNHLHLEKLMEYNGAASEIVNGPARGLKPTRPIIQFNP